MNTKEHIEQIIERTYEIVQSVFKNQQENNCALSDNYVPRSRIIFPKYRSGETRFSEQELRFIFVEQLNEEIRQGWDVYYSVETPTAKRYKFKDEPTPKVFEANEIGGQSAQFDLVIHDSSFNRIALIEFKANNAPTEHHDKDFLKLKEEGSTDTLTYFLEIVKSSNTGTSNSIQNKKKDFGGVFKCWSCSEEGYLV